MLASKIYEGQWLNDQFNGDGVHYHEDGKLRLKGTFKDGKIDGPGILFMNEKKLYEGEIENFMRNGHGTEFDEISGSTTYDG